jgi:hypothetical protein
VPFPWTNNPGRYESIEYQMTHLADLARNVTDSSSVSRQVIFRFSHHCFTDSSKKLNDFRRVFIDPLIKDDGQRVFCPKRWLMSRDLVKWLESDLSRIEVVSVGDDQWVWNKTVPGISKPYCIFFRFGVAQVGYPLIVDVKSAYVRSGGRLKGNEDRFIGVLKTVCEPDKALVPAKARKVEA